MIPVLETGLKPAGSYGVGVGLLPEKLPEGVICNHFGIVNDLTQVH